MIEVEVKNKATTIVYTSCEHNFTSLVLRTGKLQIVFILKTKCVKV